MEETIQLLKKAESEAFRLRKFDLSNQFREAIRILENHESDKRSIELERKIYNDTADMTPWERQRYFDSWSGGGS